MQIRPLQPADLALLDEVDATVDATHYLHVERTGEGANLKFGVEQRPLAARRREPRPIGDELRFALKQVAGGVDDGLGLVAEHEELPIALLLATPWASDPTVIELADVRVDFDRRREGLGSALLFQAINFARDRDARALRAEVTSGNTPFCGLLAKLGFELAGLDTMRRTNHDLVREQTTLAWYLPLR